MAWSGLQGRRAEARPFKGLDRHTEPPEVRRADHVIPGAGYFHPVRMERNHGRGYRASASGNGRLTRRAETKANSSANVESISRRAASKWYEADRIFPSAWYRAIHGLGLQLRARFGVLERLHRGP